MINYDELDRYYVGTVTRIVGNCGGILLDLDTVDRKTVLYKLEDEEDCYVDVNTGMKAQVSNGKAVDSDVRLLINERSLRQVQNKGQIVLHSSFVKRRQFEPRKYAGKSEE